MEKMLLKMAAQLNQYDTASLMALWEQYAERVAAFEPTKRWEEAALVLCLIQAVHWKNQLFNSEMLAGVRRPKKREVAALRADLKGLAEAMLNKKGAEEAPSPERASEDKKDSRGAGKGKQRRKVLVFRPGDAGKP